LDAERTHKAAWGIEREQRLAQLGTLSGKYHHERFEGLNRTSRLFGTNGEELVRHISTFVGTRQHVDDLSDEFEHETVRLFHNYLASVATLRDVQRATHRKLWPTRIPAEQRRNSNDSRTVWEVESYEPKVTALFGDDDIKFLFDLRNFTVHYAVPVMSIGTTFSHRPPEPMRQINTVDLLRAELDKYSKWSGAAKRFLATQADDVEFLPLIEKYQSRARTFYGWFWDQVKDAVRAEVDEYHGKSTEFGLWLAEEMAKPDWGDDNMPVPGSIRRNRARAHAARFANGTGGWRTNTVEPGGGIVLGESNWTPLPAVGKYRRRN